uniref:Beta-lactamase-related domain-containing protein n=1 Tax=Chromera velia CCMP2878 TaxID=1169474 RepID=A0A0G4I1F1_9ALVE|eukprot:Cvel_10144.t1-p1 / transcript=Cvel_10144.t1 / gene=Cvel_10144 / organism=Chromera_velia_CCMP2878 / gene_product=hypothetical protein / transcript_product=hypothetical protein / location=Cvel_scaffold605:19275-22878(-) / protein_length=475 / sequence_SO=supercontig / SO=protein_coding / is_pseudo=false
MNVILPAIRSGIRLRGRGLVRLVLLRLLSDFMLCPRLVCYTSAQNVGAFEEQIDHLRSIYRFPQMGVAFVAHDSDGGSAVYENCFGGCTTTDLFQVASLSKMVTGTAFLQFWEKEGFDLEEDINTLLYVVPGGRHFSSANFNATKGPSGVFEYANVNFALLGWLVEVLSGVPFPVFVRQEIFESLDIHEADASWFLQSILPNVTLLPAFEWKEEKSGGRFERVEWQGFPDYADGSLKISTSAMRKFLASFVQKHSPSFPLRSSTYGLLKSWLPFENLVFGQHVVQYERQIGGMKAVGHSGGFSGVTAEFWVFEFTKTVPSPIPPSWAYFDDVSVSSTRVGVFLVGNSGGLPNEDPHISVDPILQETLEFAQSLLGHSAVPLETDAGPHVGWLMLITLPGLLGLLVAWQMSTKRRREGRGEAQGGVLSALGSRPFSLGGRQGGARARRRDARGGYQQLSAEKKSDSCTPTMTIQRV